MKKIKKLLSSNLSLLTVSKAILSCFRLPLLIFQSSNIPVFKKVIALAVVSCFFATSVCRDAIAVISMPETNISEYKQIFDDFILPYSYGKITKSHFAATDRVIVNIQDLHCHPQVQKNINNIIELFDNKYGVSNIYLEGAYGEVSTKWLVENIKSDKKRTEILDKIMETGKLTGAEYYSAISNKTEIIKGLEKKEPYLDNLKRFGDLLEKQKEVQVILKGIEESTAKVKKQYYTRRQYKLEKLSQDYINGKIKTEKYYKLLSKHIEKLGIDISKYNNTLYYITLLNIQKKFDYKKITMELQTLLSVLKQTLPYNLYKTLLAETDNFKRMDKLYAYIIKLSQDYNIYISRSFPELNKYFGYIELSQQINPIELLKEEEILTREINTRFSDTVAQREVVFLTHFEKYLKDYISTKITSDDYEYYKENIETYKKLYNKYVDNKVLTLLKPYMEETDKFYEINMARNEYFAENIFNGVESKKIEETESGKDETNKIINNMGKTQRVDIIVTGGFHSQTVTDILEKHGVSYIVITPNVQEGIKEAEQTYYEIAKQQKEIDFQTLAAAILSEYPEPVKIKVLSEIFNEDETLGSFFGKSVSEILKIKNQTNEEFQKKYKDELNGRTIEDLIKEVKVFKNIESDEKYVNYEDFKNLVVEIGELLNINLTEQNISEICQRFIPGENVETPFINKILNFFSSDDTEYKKLEPVSKVIKSFLESVNNDTDLLFEEKDNNKSLRQYIEIVGETWQKEYSNYGDIVGFEILGSKSTVQPIKLTINIKDENSKFKTKEVVFKCISKKNYDDIRSDIIFHLQTFAQKNNIPVAELIETNTKGKYYIEKNIGEEEFYISVNDFIDGNRLNILNHKEIESFGKNIAQMHNKYEKGIPQEYKNKNENQWTPETGIDVSSERINDKIDELNKIGLNLDREKQQDRNIAHIAVLWGDKYGSDSANSLIKELKNSGNKNFEILVKQISSLRTNWNEIKSKGIPLKKAFIHADLNYENLFFNEQGELSGIIDWEHSDYFQRVMEFARIFADTQEPEMFNINVIANFLQGYQNEIDSPLKLDQNELIATAEMTRFFLISRAFETFSDTYNEGKRNTFFTNLRNLDDLYELNIKSENLADAFYKNNASVTDKNVIICRLDETFLKNGMNDGLKNIISDRVLSNSKSGGQTKIIYLADKGQNKKDIEKKLKEEGVWSGNKTEIKVGEEIETVIDNERKNEKIISVFDNTFTDEKIQEYYYNSGIMCFKLLENISSQKPTKLKNNKEYEGYGDAVIIDLDSTLFEVLHRSGILTDGDRSEINYDEFHKALVNDKLNKEVAIMILNIIERNKNIDAGKIKGEKTKIIYTTGRIEVGKNEKFKDDTLKQLKEYGMYVDDDCKIIMKPDYTHYTKDFIENTIEEISQYIKISYAIDDRGSTEQWQKIYKKNNIPCIVSPCLVNDFISEDENLRKQSEQQSLNKLETQDSAAKADALNLTGLTRALYVATIESLDIFASLVSVDKKNKFIGEHKGSNLKKLSEGMKEIEGRTLLGAFIGGIAVALFLNPLSSGIVLPFVISQILLTLIIKSIANRYGKSLTFFNYKSSITFASFLISTIIVGLFSCVSPFSIPLIVSTIVIEVVSGFVTSILSHANWNRKQEKQGTPEYKLEKGSSQSEEDLEKLKEELKQIYSINDEIIENILYGEEREEDKKLAFINIISIFDNISDNKEQNLKDLFKYKPTLVKTLKFSQLTQEKVLNIKNTELKTGYELRDVLVGIKDETVKNRFSGDTNKIKIFELTEKLKIKDNTKTDENIDRRLSGKTDEEKIKELENLIVIEEKKQMLKDLGVDATEIEVVLKNNSTEQIARLLSEKVFYLQEDKIGNYWKGNNKERMKVVGYVDIEFCHNDEQREKTMKIVDNLYRYIYNPKLRYSDRSKIIVECKIPFDQFDFSDEFEMNRFAEMFKELTDGYSDWVRTDMVIEFVKNEKELNRYIGIAENDDIIEFMQYLAYLYSLEEKEKSKRNVYGDEIDRIQERQKKFRKKIEKIQEIQKNSGFSFSEYLRERPQLVREISLNLFDKESLDLFKKYGSGFYGGEHVDIDDVYELADILLSLEKKQDFFNILDRTDLPEIEKFISLFFLRSVEWSSINRFGESQSYVYKKQKIDYLLRLLSSDKGYKTVSYILNLCDLLGRNFKDVLYSMKIEDFEDFIDFIVELDLDEKNRIDEVLICLKDREINKPDVLALQIMLNENFIRFIGNNNDIFNVYDDEGNIIGTIDDNWIFEDGTEIRKMRTSIIYGIALSISYNLKKSGKNINDKNIVNKYISVWFNNRKPNRIIKSYNNDTREIILDAAQLSDDGQKLFDTKKIYSLLYDETNEIIDRRFNKKSYFYRHVADGDAREIKTEILNEISKDIGNNLKLSFRFNGHANSKSLGLESNVTMDRPGISIRFDELSDSIVEGINNYINNNPNEREIMIDLDGIFLALHGCKTVPFSESLARDLRNKLSDLKEEKAKEGKNVTFVGSIKIESEGGIQVEYGYGEPYHNVHVDNKDLANLMYYKYLEKKGFLNAKKYKEKESDQILKNAFVKHSESSLIEISMNEDDGELKIELSRLSILPALIAKWKEAGGIRGKIAKSKIGKFLGNKDNAYKWEELVFRTAPMVAAIGLSFVGLFSLGVIFFVAFQALFLFSHTIVRWITQTDSGGEKLKEKRSFVQLAKEDLNNLAAPTIIVASIYVLSFIAALFILPAVFPVLAVPSMAIVTQIISAVTATVFSADFHRRWNNKHEIAEFITRIIKKLNSNFEHNYLHIGQGIGEDSQSEDLEKLKEELGNKYHISKYFIENYILYNEKEEDKKLALENIMRFYEQAESISSRLIDDLTFTLKEKSSLTRPLNFSKLTEQDIRDVVKKKNEPGVFQLDRENLINRLTEIRNRQCSKEEIRKEEIREEIRKQIKQRSFLFILREEDYDNIVNNILYKEEDKKEVLINIDKLCKSDNIVMFFKNNPVLTRTIKFSELTEKDIKEIINNVKTDKGRKKIIEIRDKQYSTDYEKSILKSEQRKACEEWLKSNTEIPYEDIKNFFNNIEKNKNIGKIVSSLLENKNRDIDELKILENFIEFYKTFPDDFKIEKEKDIEIFRYVITLFIEDVDLGTINDGDVKKLITKVNNILHDTLFYGLSPFQVFSLLKNNSNNIELLYIFGGVDELFYEFAIMYNAQDDKVIQNQKQYDSLNKFATEQQKLFDIFMNDELKSVIKFFKGKEFLLRNISPNRIISLNKFLEDLEKSKEQGNNEAEKKLNELTKLIEILSELNYKGLYTLGDCFALEMFLDEDFREKFEEHPIYKAIQNSEYMISLDGKQYIISIDKLEELRNDKNLSPEKKKAIDILDENEGNLNDISNADKKFLKDAGLLVERDFYRLQLYRTAGSFAVWLRNLGVDFNKLADSKDKEEILGYLINKFFDGILRKENLSEVFMNKNMGMVGATTLEQNLFGYEAIEEIYNILGWDSKGLVKFSDKEEMKDFFENEENIEKFSNGIVVFFDGHSYIGDGFMLVSNESNEDFIITPEDFAGWTKKWLEKGIKVTVYSSTCMFYDEFMPKYEKELKSMQTDDGYPEIPVENYPNFINSSEDSQMYAIFKPNENKKGKNLDKAFQTYLSNIKYINKDKFDDIVKNGLTAEYIKEIESFNEDSGISVVISNEHTKTTNEEVTKYLKTKKLLKNQEKYDKVKQDNVTLSILSPEVLQTKIKNKLNSLSGENLNFIQKIEKEILGKFVLPVINWLAEHENIYKIIIAPVWEEFTFGSVPAAITVGLIGLLVGVNAMWLVPLVFAIFIAVRTAFYKLHDNSEEKQLDTKIGKIPSRILGTIMLSMPYLAVIVLTICCPALLPVSSFMATFIATAISIGMHGLWNFISSGKYKNSLSSLDLSDKKDKELNNKIEQSSDNIETISLVNEIDLEDSIKKSNIDEIFDGDFKKFINKNGGKAIAFDDFYKETREDKSNKFGVQHKNNEEIINNSNGFALGIYFYKENRTHNNLYVTNAVSNSKYGLNLCTWEPYYKYYEDNENKRINDTDTHLKYLVKDCKEKNKKIIVFIPSILSIEDSFDNEELAQIYEEDGLDNYFRGSNTSVIIEELIWLKNYVQKHQNEVEIDYVFGAYDYLNIPNYQFFNNNISGNERKIEIENLAKLYRKIFDNDIELEYEVYKDEKKELINNILDYGNFFSSKLNFGSDLLPKQLEDESVETLNKFYTILQKFDKSKIDANELDDKFYLFKFVSKYTKDIVLIEKFVKEEIDLDYFKITTLDNLKDNQKVSFVVDKLQDKYKIEFVKEKGSNVHQNTEFIVLNLTTGEKEDFNLEGIERKFGITLRGYDSIELFSLANMEEGTKIEETEVTMESKKAKLEKLIKIIEDNTSNDLGTYIGQPMENNIEKMKQMLSNDEIVNILFDILYSYDEDVFEERIKEKEQDISGNFDKKDRNREYNVKKARAMFFAEIYFFLKETGNEDLIIEKLKLIRESEDITKVLLDKFFATNGTDNTYFNGKCKFLKIKSSNLNIFNKIFDEAEGTTIEEEINKKLREKYELDFEDILGDFILKNQYNEENFNIDNIRFNTDLDYALKVVAVSLLFKLGKNEHNKYQYDKLFEILFLEENNGQIEFIPQHLAILFYINGYKYTVNKVKDFYEHINLKYEKESLERNPKRYLEIKDNEKHRYIRYEKTEKDDNEGIKEIQNNITPILGFIDLMHILEENDIEITFEDDDFYISKKKTDEDTEEYLKISLIQFLHIYEGHSSYTNGNEVGENGSNKLRYKDRETAFDSRMDWEKIVWLLSIPKKEYIWKGEYETSSGDINDDYIIYDEKDNAYLIGVRREENDKKDSGNKIKTSFIFDNKSTGYEKYLKVVAEGLLPIIKFRIFVEGLSESIVESLVANIKDENKKLNNQTRTIKVGIYTDMPNGKTKEDIEDKDLSLIKVSVKTEQTSFYNGLMLEIPKIDKPVRIKYDKEKGELVIYSKQGLTNREETIVKENIEVVLNEILNEGNEKLNDLFPEGVQVTAFFLTDADLTKGKEYVARKSKEKSIKSLQTGRIDMITDKSKSESKGSVLKKETLEETKYGRESSEVHYTMEQIGTLSEEDFKELEECGIEIIVVVEEEGKVKDIIDPEKNSNSKYISGIKYRGEIKNNTIKELKNIIQISTRETKIIIEPTEEEISKKTIEENENIIWQLSARQIIDNENNVQGNKVRITIEEGITNAEINDMLNKGLLSGFVVKNSIQKEQLKGILTGILEGVNQFTSISKLLELANRKVNKAYLTEDKILNSEEKFEGLAKKDSDGNLIFNHEKAEKIYTLLAGKEAKENFMKKFEGKNKEETKKEIKKYLLFSDDQANKFIEDLIEEGEYEEAYGAIMGFAQLTVENVLIETLSKGDEEIKKGMRKEIRKNKNRTVRKLEMLKGFQLLALGEDIEKLIDIIEIENENRITEQVVLEGVNILNERGIKELKEMEKYLPELEEIENKEEIISDFKVLLPVLEDRLQQAKVVEKSIETMSAETAKRLLSAA